MTKKKSLRDIARSMSQESILWGRDELPFTHTHTAGHPRVLVVAGENSSGKSFFVECLLGWARAHHKKSPISVSIRERTGSGFSDMAGMRKAMMFGDQGEHGTGSVSVRVARTAFSTVQARADENLSALLVLDEPEMGLSEGFARAMGTYLAQQARQMHELACGVVIVTHSRPLVTALARELGAAPSFVKLGAAATYEQWLADQEARTVEELLELPTTDIETWRTVNRKMNELKREQDKDKKAR